MPMLMERLFTVIVCLSLFACNSDCGSPPPVPMIDYDGPVVEGDYLVLAARGDDALDYLWSGPNNFTSNDRIVEIGVAQRINAGVYYVTVSEGECDGITNSAEIFIKPKLLPCTPAKDAATFSNAPIATANFTMITCGNLNNVPTENYQIEVSSPEVQVKVLFNTPERPYYNRSYGVIGNLEYENKDLVLVQATFNGDSTTYESNATGYVYITERPENTFELDLCELGLFGENNSISITLNLKCN